MFFSPFDIIFFFMFLLGLFFFFALIHIGLMTIAFERIGLGPGQVFGFLLLSLFGSYINIPIRRIKAEITEMPTRASFFGMTYRVPINSHPGTMVSMNVGGALIPIFLSIYLMLKWQIFFEPILGVAIVSAISYRLARSVRGVGIALPLFIPPLLAALVAILISSSEYTPAVAYISGTLGTLIGADLLHLKDISRINAPVVSIGGAGTFDGIFLTGIIAVLLA